MSTKTLPKRGEPGGPLERQLILRKISQRRCDRAKRGLPAATPVEWLGWEDRRPPAVQPGTPALSVMAVVGDVDCESFITGLLDFLTQLPLETRDAWWRNLTKTLFFTGNPAEQIDHGESAESAHRADLAGGGEAGARDFLADSGAIGWLGPGGPERFTKLPLERFGGSLKVPDEVPVYVPGGAPTGRRMLLRVATKSVTGRAYLTHVHHVLSEAYLRSFLRPGDRLEVQHDDELDPVEEIPAGNRDFEARIANDSRSPGCLRLYANLTVVPALHGAP
ncbi:hypothetical protein EV138_1270 [Kribbella voronezhensis]|uniref:Uncharacterized protein n=1 Tax=Kribbella voronezhensis TaxID=2512212 RepID=A0A4R7T754_9ACTN|nr:DUF6182 family protein [Kribbella voronezhensis]TDU87742.1 hypothetical protein EV138_1270 [Kribbella voronezhensis]